MSPVSRGRQGRKNKNKKSTRRSALRLVSTQDECDRLWCSGEDFDPRRLIEALIADAVDLVGIEDPLDVEIAGAAFVSIGEIAGETFEDALVGGFIPQFEARGGAEALAMVLAIGSVAEGRAGEAASAAADRLVRRGIPRPRWAAELGEPLTVADCWRIIDTQGDGSILACSFHRAGRSHAVVMSVDHLDCGAATGVVPLGADQLPEALEMMRAGARDAGYEIEQEALDPAELRWHVEAALDARVVHDNDARELGLDDGPVDDDRLPDYRSLATLLRVRMKALPKSSKPPAPHGAGVFWHGHRRLAEDGFVSPTNRQKLG